VIGWINFASIIISGTLMTYFYVRSVSPAKLEQKIGEIAYKRCGMYRMVSSIFMLTLTVSYIVYHFYPLPIDPFPVTFGWPYWVSVLIVVVISGPPLYLMLRGIRDAGEETMKPDKAHTMYTGIYEKIRHPQAVGEAPMWIVIAFLVNSPFLVVFSIIWIPVWMYWCWAEEQDLVLRYGEPYEAYRQRTGMFFPKRH
jgi:protein-S-isoprenylcysteine O-methyltransferase Ste14